MENARNYLLICRTCPRNTSDTGRFGRVLARCLSSRLRSSGITLLMVNCLGSCKHPGAVVLDAPHKDRVRLDGLSVLDAEAVVAAADAYVKSSPGTFNPQTLESSMRKHLSAISPKPPSRQTYSEEAR